MKSTLAIVPLIMTAFGMAGLAAEPPSRAQLVAEVESVQPGTPFRVGLLMTLRESWHTYWRNPGDAGMAPVLEWQLPPGFSAGPLLWPAPEEFDEPPLLTFGYRRQVLLYREIRPPADLAVGGTCTVGVQAAWLVCAGECVPQTDHLQLTLPVRAAAPAPAGVYREQFARAREETPAVDPAWRFDVRVEATALWLCVTPPPGTPPAAVMHSVFFPEQQNLVAYDRQSWQRSAEQYQVCLRRTTVAGPLPARLRGALVLPRGDLATAKALEVDTALPASAAAQPEQGGGE
jgi:DsbC/DsbD-like thiol-disulfide interchange protein